MDGHKFKMLDECPGVQHTLEYESWKPKLMGWGNRDFRIITIVQFCFRNHEGTEMT